MSEKRSRTVSIRRQNRAQTTQDFAIGMGIFLLAVAFAFSTVPSIVGTHAVSSDGAARAQTDRVTAAIVDDLETGEKPNELDGDRFKNEYDRADLTARFGLRTTDEVDLESITISLETIDREDELVTRGDEYADDQPAIAVNRIVSVDGVRDCQPACRLTVRVWY